MYVSHTKSWFRILYGHLKSIIFENQMQLAVHSRVDARKNTNMYSVILKKIEYF
jgi:hypothetical protein